MFHDRTNEKLAHGYLPNVSLFLKITIAMSLFIVVGSKFS
jgi:hypothetical protein